MNSYLAILAALLLLLVCIGTVYLIIRSIKVRQITYPETGVIVVGNSSDMEVGTELIIGGAERVRVVKADGSILTVEYIGKDGE
jgi:hypothetical protein